MTFLGTLSNVSATLKAANRLLPPGAEPFILSVDSGTSWSCPEGDGTTACYPIPYHGKNQSVARHVVDLADVTIHIHHCAVCFAGTLSWFCHPIIHPSTIHLFVCLSRSFLFNIDVLLCRPCQEVVLMDYDTD
eukprot:COSAG01_NODE_31557_length_595_cov_1.580645_1_plen_132_part_10